MSTAIVNETNACAADLQGMRALVTGGTKGLGAAIARHLDAAGARVVVAARNVGGVMRAR